MRVLTVCAEVPFPPVGGARTRNHHLLRALAEDHEVVVTAFDMGSRGVTEPPGIDLRAVPWEEPPLHTRANAGDAAAWQQLAASSAEPFAVSWYASPTMEFAIGTALAEGVDAVVMTESAMGRFAPLVPPGVARIADLHDVHARKAERLGEAPAEVARIRRFESELTSACELTVCVSAQEAAAARELLAPRRVEVVPNGVDTTRFVAAAAGDPDRIVFTGSLHTPSNVEAVLWLAQEVMPRLRALRPSVVLDVVGSKPAPEVHALAGAALEVHADVPSTVEYLQRAAVAVVGIRHGGGTRLKILEAAACARPVVTTTAGAEGLELVPGDEFVVADDPQEFAAVVAELCADDTRRARLGDAARRGAGRYDWRGIGARYRALVEEAVLAREGVG